MVDQENYQLTRRGFIDAVYNRIAIVRFLQTSSGGIVIKLPNTYDRFGRFQVLLRIGGDQSVEDQAHTLVHEMIHIDRDVWTRFEGTLYHHPMKDVEEELTEISTNKFYSKYPKLALKALNHVWLRKK